jgi:methyl-accepting chemotaxis protein
MAKNRTPSPGFDPLGGAPLDLLAEAGPTAVAPLVERHAHPQSVAATWGAGRSEEEWFRVLDEVQTNIMIADLDLRLAYANKRALATFRSLQKEIKAAFGVGIDEMTGGSIHRFHRDPALIERLLADPTALPRQATFHFGNVTLETRINRIRDGHGRLQGYVVAWEDVSERTRLDAEVRTAAERERWQAAALREKVDSMLAVVQAAGHGDLTHDVSVRGEDAIGQMGEGLAALLRDLRRDIGVINRNASALAKASRTLMEVSQQMGANSEETSTQAHVVASNAKTVSDSLQTIATAVEEMTASIAEISTNATKASEMAAEAVRVTDRTNAIITTLGRSTSEIGDVIKLITSIAEQTNLLALNATIEAARAGDAGRGFAVVASEVKELAKETAGATEDISARIEAIQRDTEGAVAAISDISGMIKRINDIQAVIATAVEEQSATSAEMSANITRAASSGLNISSNIDGVAEAAQNTAGGASEAQTAAAQLADMAAELQEFVGRFRVEAAALPAPDDRVLLDLLQALGASDPSALARLRTLLGGGDR